MKIKQTNRGFDIAKFKDRYGAECSLQKSSLATEDCIWLGIDNVDPQIMIEGRGWQPYNIPPEVMLSSRMHLNREMVAKLLPILQLFVKTGELTPPPQDKLKTAEEWLKTKDFKSYQILDPDGWDRVHFDKSWKEKITKQEMWKRTMKSTIKQLKKNERI